MSSYERQSCKSQATTLILEQQLKNNYQLSVCYSWEEERIVAQLVRMRPTVGYQRVGLRHSPGYHQTAAAAGR